MSSKTSNRLPSLDLARVLAMFMMIQGHTIYATANPQFIDTSLWYWDIWAFLRGFTAPVFLTVSGAVHVFANKRNEFGVLPQETVKRRIKTALVLLIVGYLLVFPAGRIYDVFFIEHKYWMNFYKVNILQLFGFTLLYALLIFRFTKNDKQVFIVCFLSAALFASLLSVQESISNSALPNFFKSYFVFSNGSLFPVIPYSSYFFIGVCFGVILKNTDPEQRPKFFFKWGLPLGVIFLLVSLPFSGNNANLWSMIKSFNQSNPAIVLQREAFVMFGLFLVSILHTLIGKYQSIYIRFGKRALWIYVIHLILIYGGDSLPGIKSIIQLKTLEIHQAMFAALIVETLSFGITYFVDRSLSEYKRASSFYKYSISLFLIYMLFF